MGSNSDNDSIEELRLQLIDTLELLEFPWLFETFCSDNEAVELARTLLSKLNAMTRSRDKSAPPERGTNYELEELIYNSEQGQQDQYVKCKANPDWQRTYSFLRSGDGYWHVTTPEAWEAIKTSGAIKPNINGRFPMRFPSTARRSYGFRHECVFLFDFVSPTEEEVICQWRNAWSVIVSQHAPMVLLRLDRRPLESNVIPNGEAWQRVDKKIFGVIPFCEVWYPDEIPTTTIRAVFRVPPHDRLRDFRPEEINEPL